MSGPYCKDCVLWIPLIRSEQGECTDYSKVIHTKHCGSKEATVITDPTDSCMNHRPASHEDADTDIIAMCYKNGKGVVVVRHVLCHGFPRMSSDEMAELSRKLSSFRVDQDKIYSPQGELDTKNPGI